MRLHDKRALKIDAYNGDWRNGRGWFAALGLRFFDTEQYSAILIRGIQHALILGTPGAVGVVLLIGKEPSIILRLMAGT